MDVVLELVGAAHLERVVDVLAPHARVVIIGVGGGSRATIDLLRVMSRRLVLTGSTLRDRSREEKALVVAAAREWLDDRWRDGAVTMPLAQRFDLARANDAYEEFARPGKFGKIVLTVDA